MSYPYRERVRGRRPQRHWAPLTAGINWGRPAVILEHMLGLPIVDRMLGRALHHPRLLQWLGVLAGLVIVALALRPLFVLSAGTVVVTPLVQASSRAAAPAVTPGDGLEQRATSSGESEVLAVVAAYNQASITAALLGRADIMAPYLAPDGTA